MTCLTQEQIKQLLDALEDPNNAPLRKHLRGCLVCRGKMRTLISDETLLGDIRDLQARRREVRHLLEEMSG